MEDVGDTKVRSIVYGPDDRLTACIASWQLIQGSELFLILEDVLTRYTHSPVVYYDGEEHNHCVLDLSFGSGHFAEVRWHSETGNLWRDFLIHAQEMFLLEWEHIYRPAEPSREPTITRSPKASKLLSLAPCPIISHIEAIPNTERPVRAL